MRPILAFALAASAALWFSLPAGARAGEDASRELRLLSVEGKFEEVRRMLATAGDDVKNDVKLRRQIAENALKFIKRRVAEERKDGLDLAMTNFGAAWELEPVDMESAQTALECARELAQIEREGNQPVVAEERAAWGVAFGEKVMGAGVVPNTVKAAVAEVYKERARVSHKVKHLERIVADFQRSAGLLEECAQGETVDPDDLASAAEAQLLLAQFVSENIPTEEEKRDDEAIRRAVALADQACNAKGAEQLPFSVHLLSLRAARQMGVKEDLGLPYMTDLKHDVKGLELRVPRAGGWKSEEFDRKKETYQIFLTRRFADETKTLQIMVSEWQINQPSHGTTWEKIEEMAQIRYEGQKDRFGSVVSEVKVQQLEASNKPKGKGKAKGKKKDKGPEIWFFQYSGTLKQGGRQQRQSEWLWRPSKKEKTAYHLQIFDWDAPWGTDDPDVTLFIQSAIGEEYWPLPE